MTEPEPRPYAVSTSVIIVNYNGRYLLKKCLTCLSLQDTRDFEVIVVDNGSRDGSVNWLQALQYPWLKLVLLDRNTGFGIANNRGFNISSGKYIVILNNDTEVPPDFIQTITAPFQETHIDMVAPLIVYRDNPEIVDKAGGHRLYPDGLNRGRACGRPLKQKHTMPGDCFYPDGCAAAFRRSLLASAGFFDEGFFLYGEDTELGLRYYRFGARCYYQPAARVYHVHSATAGKYSPQKAYFVERNRYRILFLCFPWVWILLSPLFTLVRYGFQGIAALFGIGSPGAFSKDHSRGELLSTLYRANRDGIRMIPELLRIRRERKHLYRTGTLRFTASLFRYFLSPLEIAFRK